jgi:hypothetical protein
MQGVDCRAQGGMSTAALVHVEAPAVGFVDVRMFPNWSPATQTEADGQETVDGAPADRWVVLHWLAPPVGLVDVKTLP